MQIQFLFLLPFLVKVSPQFNLTDIRNTDSGDLPRVSDQVSPLAPSIILFIDVIMLYICHKRREKIICIFPSGMHNLLRSEKTLWLLIPTKLLIYFYQYLAIYNSYRLNFNQLIEVQIPCFISILIKIVLLAASGLPNWRNDNNRPGQGFLWH